MREILLSKSCVPLSKIVSELWITPDEVKYHLRKVAKYIPIGIRIETENSQTKRLGIRFTSLLSTGSDYRHKHEWKGVEQMLNEGKLTLKELSEKLRKSEFKFLFEELIRERIKA